MRSFLTLAENVAVNDMAAVPEGAFDKLMYGLNVSLIGMLTVFAVLALIMGVLYLFRLYFYTLPQKRAAEAAGITPAPKAAPSQAVSAPVAVAASDDDELVPVVIAAAVAAYMETNAPKSKYRIRSFKRI